MPTNVLVFDAGAYHVCYGPAEEETPEIVKRATATNDGFDEGKVPFYNGELVDKDRLSELLNMATDDLNMRPEENYLFMSHPSVMPMKDRASLCEVVFEGTNFPGFYTAGDASLALFSTGRPSGVVLNIGYSGTSAVPVNEGYSIPHACFKSPLSAQKLDEIIKSFNPDLVDLSPEDMTTLKTQFCKLTSGQLSAVFSKDSGKTDFQIPGGSHVSVGNEASKALEALFSPNFFGIKSSGCHELLSNAIFATDADAWEELLPNIMVVGGTSRAAGFIDRIKRELLGVLDFDFTMVANSDLHEVWNGGSTMGSLDYMTDMWIKKSLYEEQGPESLANAKLYA